MSEKPGIELGNGTAITRRAGYEFQIEDRIIQIIAEQDIPKEELDRLREMFYHLIHDYGLTRFICDLEPEDIRLKKIEALKQSQKP